MYCSVPFQAELFLSRIGPAASDFEVHVRDTDSTNGTKLNKKEIRSTPEGEGLCVRENSELWLGFRSTRGVSLVVQKITPLSDEQGLLLSSSTTNKRIKKTPLMPGRARMLQQALLNASPTVQPNFGTPTNVGEQGQPSPIGSSNTTGTLGRPALQGALSPAPPQQLPHQRVISTRPRRIMLCFFDNATQRALMQMIEELGDADVVVYGKGTTLRPSDDITHVITARMTSFIAKCALQGCVVVFGQQWVTACSTERRWLPLLANHTVFRSSSSPTTSTTSLTNPSSQFLCTFWETNPFHGKVVALSRKILDLPDHNDKAFKNIKALTVCVQSVGGTVIVVDRDEKGS